MIIRHVFSVVQFLESLLRSFQNSIVSSRKSKFHRLTAKNGNKRKGYVVSPVELSTVGSRHFPVAAAQLWNNLPDDIVLADSLSTFRRQLKHYLFQQSYRDNVL